MNNLIDNLGQKTNKKSFFDRTINLWKSRKEESTARLPRARKNFPWLTLLECLLIIGWAFWVGRGYLDFSTTTIPRGDEISLVTDTHYIWTMLFKCGACVMWNGSINGGAPAFAELMGSVLHPLTIVVTLIWGVINGTKLLIILSLAVAGLGQWWTARVLKLGWVARLWSAGMAVIGGELMGKMDNGSLPALYSIAFASLIIAPGLELALTRKRRSLILLAIMLALTWLSGQGYTQVVVVIGLLPAFIIFLFDSQFHIKPVWKDFALAGLLSALFVGVFLVPLLHFWPNIIKDGDPYLTGYAPLQYNPLDLVIGDWKFFQTEILGHSLNLYHYFIYIGWVPVILAILTLRFVPKEKSKILAFLWLGVGLIFLVCSIDFMKLVQYVLPQVGFLRYMYISCGLVVPLMLALAAWGLDYLTKIKLPKIGILLPSGTTVGFSLSIIVIGVPLILAMKPGYEMSKLWLVTVQLDPSTATLSALQTSSTEWISPPSTEYPWITILLDSGYKITGIFRPWRWNDRQEPQGYLQIVRDSQNTVTDNVVATNNDLKVVRQSQNEYAYIQAGDKVIPCKATAMGGNIDVQCTSDTSGTLIVQENNYSGWTAKVDSKPTALYDNDFLTVQALAGTHTYTFRYRPWDVPVGILVTLAGIALAIWIGLHKIKSY